MSGLLTYDGRLAQWRDRDGFVVAAPEGPGSGSPPTARDLLVAGTYEPDETTAGLLPGVPLTPFFGDIVARNGQVLQNLDIHGRVSGAATDVSAKNCRIRGGLNPSSAQDSSRGLAHSTNAAVRRWMFEDCHIEPDTPHNSYNGFLGHDVTFRRCRFRHASDGGGIFNTNNPDAPVNVTVEGCLMDEFYFIRPSDTGTRKEGTHNDGIQISGGSNIRIVGNKIRMFYDPTIGSASSTDPVTGNQYYPWMTGTSCIIITPNVGVVADVLIDRNWFDGGATSVNVSEKGRGAIRGLVITNNRFGRVQRSGKQALIPATTYDVATISGNVWADGGSGSPIIQRVA